MSQRDIRNSQEKQLDSPEPSGGVWGGGSVPVLKETCSHSLFSRGGGGAPLCPLRPGSAYTRGGSLLTCLSDATSPETF